MFKVGDKGQYFIGGIGTPGRGVPAEVIAVLEGNPRPIVLKAKESETVEVLYTVGADGDYYLDGEDKGRYFFEKDRVYVYRNIYDSTILGNPWKVGQRSKPAAKSGCLGYFRAEVDVEGNRYNHEFFKEEET